MFLILKRPTELQDSSPINRPNHWVVVGVACPGLGVGRGWTYANPIPGHTTTTPSALSRHHSQPNPPTPLHNHSPCGAGSTSSMPPPTPNQQHVEAVLVLLVGGGRWHTRGRSCPEVGEVVEGVGRVGLGAMVAEGGWGWGGCVACPGLGLGIRPPSAHPQTRARHPYHHPMVGAGDGRRILKFSGPFQK